jgi:hypothetical protein
MFPKAMRRVLGPVLILLFLGGVLLHAETLRAVEVTLIEGAQEPGDGALLGKSAPDYRLEVRAQGRWIECATFKDTPIGEGLRFELPGTVPRGAVTDLRLVEDDAANDDLLEELPVEGDAVSGKAFHFELENGWAIGAGFEWFLGTPAGIVLALGAGLAILVLAGSFALRGVLEG